MISKLEIGNIEGLHRCEDGIRSGLHLDNLRLSSGRQHEDIGETDYHSTRPDKADGRLLYR